MGEQGSSYHVNAELLAGWLAARSIVRGLPPPVPEYGGMRVETGLANEIRRYLFAGPVRQIRDLARSISGPLIPIKMCGSGEQLLALLPPGWQLQSISYLMTHGGAADAPILPAGYKVEVSSEHAATLVRIVAADGSLGASGYAVEYGGFFVFDQIVTEPTHRRRGLGKALMAALGSTQRSSTARRVLVATEDGRALYSSLA